MTILPKNIQCIVSFVFRTSEDNWHYVSSPPNDHYGLCNVAIVVLETIPVDTSIMAPNMLNHYE